MTEPIETFEAPEAADEQELTVQDILDQAAETPYHTILEMWREVLLPSRTMAQEKVSPQWASRLVNSFPELRYADTPKLAEVYYDGISELLSILELEIAQDDECLKQTSAEEDVAYNGARYLNILTEWQALFLMWELEWDATSELAAIEIASMSEIHKMFFDPQGITALLDQINFQVTDADREVISDRLKDVLESARSEVNGE